MVILWHRWKDKVHIRKNGKGWILQFFFFFEKGKPIYIYMFMLRNIEDWFTMSIFYFIFYNKKNYIKRYIGCCWINEINHYENIWFYGRPIKWILTNQPPLRGICISCAHIQNKNKNKTKNHNLSMIKIICHELNQTIRLKDIEKSHFNG